MKIKFLVLALSSLFLISCGGDSKDKPDLTIGTGARGLPNGQVRSAAQRASVTKDETSLNGRIYIDTQFSSPVQTPEQFQQQVVSLLSAQLVDDEIGTVDGSVNSNQTGISFWGRGLNLNEGDFDPRSLTSNPALQQNIFNTQSAELRVSIFQQLESGLQEVPIHFNSFLENANTTGQLVESYVEGELIQLIFADEFGKFSLDGFIRQDAQGFYQYEGQALFRNTRLRGELNTNQEAQLLGRFSIRACGFFNCPDGVL